MSSQCAGKRQYPTLRDARAQIKSNRQQGIRTAFRLRAYLCDICGAYHLTKQQD